LERFLYQRGTAETGIEEDVILREQLSALDQAMRELQPREREILMRRLMGETPQQIALAYQLKPRSISMVVLRAKEKIEANLIYLQNIRRKEGPDA
jgi:RNA polymerase sigma factor (sigma-70 family)